MWVFSILHMSFINFIVFQMKIALTLLFPSTVIFFHDFSYLLFSSFVFMSIILISPKLLFHFKFIVKHAQISSFFFFSFIMYAFNRINMSQDTILLLHFSFNSYKIMKFDFDFSLVHMLFRNRLLNTKPNKDFQNFGYWLLF